MASAGERALGLTKRFGNKSAKRSLKSYPTSKNTRGMADDADDFKPRPKSGGLNRGRYNNAMRSK